MARNLGLHVSTVEGNNIRVVGPKKNITDALRQYITDYKSEIIELLTRQGNKVPESFKERACRRCGSHEAVKRDDGLWICPCYFTWQPAPAIKQRPTWESLMLRNRGLAYTCSVDECSEDAVWYGKGCTAYCDEHWPGDRHEVWKASLDSTGDRQLVASQVDVPDFIELRLPEWLKVGTSEWNIQVERNGLQEMMERRQIAIEQERERQASLIECTH